MKSLPVIALVLGMAWNPVELHMANELYPTDNIRCGIEYASEYWYGVGYTSYPVRSCYLVRL